MLRCRLEASGGGARRDGGRIPCKTRPETGRETDEGREEWVAECGRGVPVEAGVGDGPAARRGGGMVKAKRKRSRAAEEDADCAAAAYGENAEEAAGWLADIPPATSRPRPSPAGGDAASAKAVAGRRGGGGSVASGGAGGGGHGFLWRSGR